MNPKGQFHPAKNGEVLTNHFEIDVDPGVMLYEFRVVGIPETERGAGKKRYMKTFIDQTPSSAPTRLLLPPT